MQTFGPVIQGTAIHLYASAPGAVSLSIDNGIGVVSNPSTTVVNPTATITYTCSQTSPTPPTITTTAQIKVLIGLPSPLQYLQAQSLCNSNIALQWGASQFTNSYIIERSPTLGNNWTTLATQSGTTYTDTTSILGSVYDYRVTPSDGLNFGTPGIIQTIAATGTPLAPTNPVATPFNSYVVIQANLSVGATSYNLWRGLATGAEVLIESNLTAPAYTDQDVQNGVQYFYYFTASSACGTSGSSTEVSATPLLADQYYGQSSTPSTFWG